MPVIIRGLSGLSKKIKDATATPADIVSGKVAYGNDHARMVGTHVCRKKNISLNLRRGETVNVPEATSESMKQCKITQYYMDKVENNLYLHIDSDSYDSIAIAKTDAYPDIDAYRESIVIFKKAVTNILITENTALGLTLNNSRKTTVVVSKLNLSDGVYSIGMGSGSFLVHVDGTMKQLYLTFRIRNKAIVEIAFGYRGTESIKNANIEIRDNDFCYEVSWI